MRLYTPIRPRVTYRRDDDAAGLAPYRAFASRWLTVVVRWDLRYFMEVLMQTNNQPGSTVEVVTVHRKVDEAELAAAAFLARYSGRTLDAYRQDLRSFFDGRHRSTSKS